MVGVATLVLFFLVSSTTVGGQSTNAGCRPLVDGNPKLPNAAFSTRSSFLIAAYPPHSARFSSTSGWISLYPTAFGYPYLQVDVGQALITRLATKGVGTNGYRTTSYNASFSLNGIEFYNYSQIFTGNNDSNTPVNHTLTRPTYARYIRVYPLTYSAGMGLRLEVYGCPASSSSLKPKNITAIAATSGSVTLNWNKSFKDAEIRHTRCYRGVVEHINATIVHDGYFCLDSAFTPRLTVGKLVPLTTYRFTLFAESYGYKISDAEIVSIRTTGSQTSSSRPVSTTVLQGCRAMIDGNPKLLSSAFTSSTIHPSNRYPSHFARFSITTGWLSAYSEVGEYLQVDIGLTFVQGLATKGLGNAGHWSVTYNLSFSINNQDWMNYGQTFNGNFDRSTMVNHTLPRPVYARYVKVEPIAYVGRPALRLEIYGCPVSSPSLKPKNVTVTQTTPTSVTISWRSPVTNINPLVFHCYSLVVEHINATIVQEGYFCHISVYNPTETISGLAPSTQYRLTLFTEMRGYKVSGPVVLPITTAAASATLAATPATIPAATPAFTGSRTPNPPGAISTSPPNNQGTSLPAAPRTTAKQNVSNSQTKEPVESNPNRDVIIAVGVCCGVIVLCIVAATAVILHCVRKQSIPSQTPGISTQNPVYSNVAGPDEQDLYEVPKANDYN